VARGERREAVEVARAVLARSDPMKSGLSPFLKFFLDEEAVADAWGLYAAFPDLARTIEDEWTIRLASAMTRSADPGLRASGRTLAMRLVREAASLKTPVLELIRDVLMDADPGAVAKELRGLGTHRAALEAFAMVACFAARLPNGSWPERNLDDLQAAMRDLGASGPETSPAGMLAAARALFRCGRFEDAYRIARGMIEQGFRSVPLRALVRLAVRAGLAAGVSDAPRRIQDAVFRVVEDRIERARLVATILRNAGDFAGLATVLLDLAQEAPLDARTAMQALQAAFQAGDRALADRAASFVFGASRSRREAALTMAGLARRFLRDDWAIPWLEAELRVWPGDPDLLHAAMEASVRSAQVGRAGPAIERFIEGSGERGWADVVEVAAEHLILPVVTEGVSRLERMPPADRAARALMRAAFAVLRAGRIEQGRAVLVLALSRARDRREMFSQLAQWVIGVPEVPDSLMDEMLETAQDRADLIELPLVRAARCLPGATSVEQAVQCVRSSDPYYEVEILMMALRKALLERRLSAAEVLVRALGEVDHSRGVAIRAAAAIVATLWPPTGDPADPSAAVANAGREVLLRTGSEASPGFIALEAHLKDLAQGRGAGCTVYEQRLRVAPEDATARNNLAYSLSAGGVDLRRAVQEARLAVALGSRGHVFSLETLAWALFLNGETRKALETQSKAANLWNLKQDGGLAESFLHLGRLYEAAGRAQAALESYRRAAVLEPLEGPGLEALRRWRALGGPQRIGVE